MTNTKIIKRFKIQEMLIPFDGYKYNVQVLTSSDCGNTFYYAGEGRFTRTRAEAQEYINNYIERNKDTFTFMEV